MAQTWRRGGRRMSDPIDINSLDPETYAELIRLVFADQPDIAEDMAELAAQSQRDRIAADRLAAEANRLHKQNNAALKQLLETETTPVETAEVEKFGEPPQARTKPRTTSVDPVFYTREDWKSF